MCFVFSRLDYSNSTLAGLQRLDIDRLQAIQNAAVRLSGAWKYDHVMQLLCAVHWLLIKQRIQFKVAVMVYKLPARTNC